MVAQTHDQPAAGDKLHRVPDARTGEPNEEQPVIWVSENSEAPRKKFRHACKRFCGRQWKCALHGPLETKPRDREPGV